jgi:hypothetical protein
MQRVCVYLGSNPGVSPMYEHAAKELGAEIARRGMGLVYGGACVGLMGRLADAALQAGAEVVGVMPVDLQRKEIAHPGLTDLHLVETMHERKALMSELSDGFAALPGGLGALDEIAEALTWSQLRIHDKPCGLLNVEGYFNGLLAFLDHATQEGFIPQGHRDMVLTADEPGELLDKLSGWTPTPCRKWVEAAPRP